MLHLSSFVGMDDNDAGDIYGEAGSLSWQRRRAGRERNSRIMLCHSGPKWGVNAMVIMMLMLVIILLMLAIALQMLATVLLMLIDV